MEKKEEKTTERQEEKVDDPIDTVDVTEESVEDGLEDLIEIPVEEGLKESIESPVEEVAEESIEEAEDSVEEIGQQTVDKPIKPYKKIVIGTMIVFCSLMLIYLGITAYFINHFYFGSEINGINIFGKSIEEAAGLIEAEFQDYTLTLKERGGKNEQIKAAEIDLGYHSREVLEELKDRQNPFGWILAWLNKKDFKITVEITYDEKLLRERIESLDCFDRNNIIEPRNPSFQYIKDKYVMVDEILGNKIDKDILYSYVADVLLKKEIEIDLESIHCYIEPKYNSRSQKMIATQATLNKYISSEITYIFGDKKEVIDGSMINQWLSVGKSFEVIIDEEKVEDYLGKLSEKYNTPNRIRDFVTSSGETIQISGGDFSQPIHIEEETKSLISDIKEGQTITREPVYGQTVISHVNGDIGDTYVEIDLTKQHIWFYKNNSLIVEGDVVTGNVSSGHTTPKGVYRLKYKAKNVVLRGPGYASPVNFWMPFNGGIGIHDANWRSTFGGEIYKTNGSHGCINCPNDVAKAIYNNIAAETPVICY